ncbi:hypothetical protein JAAARDRAFT_38386 [Jaapia argillacea MUCL 33604]|uniref:Uncharacterized protein n=1 Tax=Jaapia argillacea MUCL 33604 TaxID=933084 RepID=A0A067PHE0_9AGAM|nr:hypothetical protein JAAARDRAFT_38386 [Jaapia argillacea MUCL 33604]
MGSISVGNKNGRDFDMEMTPQERRRKRALLFAAWHKAHKRVGENTPPTSTLYCHSIS